MLSFSFKCIIVLLINFHIIEKQEIVDDIFTYFLSLKSIFTINNCDGNDVIIIETVRESYNPSQ